MEGEGGGVDQGTHFAFGIEAGFWKSGSDPEQRTRVTRPTPRRGLGRLIINIDRHS